MFVVVKDFDYETFEDVIGPFDTREDAQEYVSSRQPTHWNYHVVELTSPFVID